MSKLLFKSAKVWFAPKFPEHHIKNILAYNPEGFSKKLNNLYRTWVVHPIRRRIAKYYLVFLRKFFGLKVIGITGSSGKTTTKEMVVSILKQKGETVFSFANIDPVYNIPTTIFRCKTTTKYLVLEMGIEYPGEMDFYLWLAKPDVGVITNIFPTHTLFFGDERGVAKEKGRLVKSLFKGDIAILNKENKYLREIGEKVKSKIVWFGDNGNIVSKDIKILPNLDTKYSLEINKNKIDIMLPVIGEQFVQDSLAAAAVADSLGFSLKEIKKGLERYQKPEHRMNTVKLKSGAVLIDDSYNNNPSAAKETLKTFKSIIGSKKSIVVFGDMLELGKDEKKYHREIGDLISSYKFDYLIGVGKLSKLITDKTKRQIKNTYWVESQGEVMSILKPLLNKGSITLIKGSRSIGLDKVVTQLL